jgi:putative heme-binding domain-containing protein
MEALLRRAVEFAQDSTLPNSLRLAAVRLLSHAEPALSRETLAGLLGPKTPSEVRSAAAHAVIQLNDPELSKMVVNNWTSLGPRTRRQLLAESPRSMAIAAQLLAAAKDGGISALEIAPGTRGELQRIGDRELQRGFVELFKPAGTGDRAEVVRQFEPALPLEGNAQRGAEIFGRTCLTCHLIKGRGTQVGPDLSTVGTRPKPTLLVDILDPSRAVSSDWLSYTIERNQGDAVSGLIVAETASHITLRRAQQPDESIPRPQIKEIKADGKSLMPEGLEQGMTGQDMADLLEFLRKPEPAWLPPE